jgi:short-subunit dehydrogenase
MQELRLIAADLKIRYSVSCVVCMLDLVEIDAHSRQIADCIQSAFPLGLAGVVLCSGFSGDQKSAEVAWSESKQILDVNFVGCVSILNQLAGYFESRGGGFIAVITSVAGDRGRQSNYIYGAAKAGMTTYLEGLRNRLHSANVSVTTIKPGYVDTPMTFGKPGVFMVASPRQVARSIVRSIARRRHTAYVPGFWRWIMMVVRSVPEPIFKRLHL